MAKSFKNSSKLTSETEKAYLAGLIDGEGYIGITKTRRPKWKGRMDIELTPRIQINMTRARDLLEELAERYAGKVYVHMITNKKSHWVAPDMLFIRQSEEKITKFLQDILPYLRVKRRQAELLLEYFRYRSPHGLNSEKNLPEQFRIYNELKALNWHKRGKPKLLRLEDHVRARKRTGKPPIIDRDELYDLYWNKNMLPIEIAKVKGCTRGWVSVLLKRYGIPRRGKSASIKLLRKKRGSWGSGPPESQAATLQRGAVSAA